MRASFGNRISIAYLTSRPPAAIWSSRRNATEQRRNILRAFEQMLAEGLSSCDTKGIHPKRVNVCQFKEDNNHVVHQTRTRCHVPRS